jgi:glyoxylate reductase
MGRPKVYLTRKLPEEARAIVAARCDFAEWREETTPVPRDELLRRIAGVDGVLTLLTERVDGPFLDAAPRYRVVANMAVGYDNVDLAELTRRGVLLTNTPGVLTETTADLVWALILSTARRIVESAETIKQDRWTTWSPMFLTGYDVFGATLGIVGAGRIGAAVARRAQGFKMPIIYHNRRPAPTLEAETGAQNRALDDLLREADVVVVQVPLSDATRGMFGHASSRL